MDQLRVAIAAVALAVPSVMFALNGYISYRERGIVEPYDIPAAIAFAALVGGAVLCAIYLASVVTSGPAVFIAYWIVALVLIAQALALVRRSAVSST